jgi:hypothetical protein
MQATPPPSTSWSISSQSQNLQSRFQQYLSSITTQSLFLFGLCILFAILNVFTIDDLVSRAFTLDRIEITKEKGMFDIHPTTNGILLFLSLFSPIHGLFVVIFSCYLGKEIFVENETKLMGYFLPALAFRQFIISVCSLLMDKLWYVSFPQAWLRFVNQYLLKWLESPNNLANITHLAGFGGLLPLYLCLETEKSFSSPSLREEQVELPMIPFTVTRKYKGFVVAFLLSLFNGGDVDLFAGVLLGVCLSSSQKLITLIRTHREQLSASVPTGNTVSATTRSYGGSTASRNTEEAVSLLAAAGKQSTSTTGLNDTATTSDAEKRAILLAAAEKRLGEREPDVDTSRNNQVV